MRLQLQTAAFILALLAAATPHVEAKGLRRKLARNDCTVMAVEALGLEGNEDPEMILECELDPADADGYSGISLPLAGTEAQLNTLKNLIINGSVTPGHNKLNIGGAEIGEDSIHVPPGLDIAALVRQNVESEGRRRLVDTLGNLNMLLVKVTDSVGKVYPDSASLMSDEVFGTGVDPVNLKSALEECSWDKLTVVPGLNDANEVATGVIEVTIPITLEGNARGTIRNAVTTEVQNLLGHSLPGPYDYVLYSLENCYQDCGWAAYAYINSWNSVYQGVYYKRPGVLVHELGHNFGLAHSGGLDGATYTDHTCSMGNPHYGDDTFQCFNPAKNFQLNWYDDAGAKLIEDPRIDGFSKTFTFVGIDEYDLRGNNPVTLKLETGTVKDYFVGFNRSNPNGTGPNRMNDEGDNVVTVIQVQAGNGVSYGQSFLKAKLTQGQSYEIIDYAGTGKPVKVTVNQIDINAVPGFASVTVSAVPPPPTNPPTPPPTNPPTNPPPTPNPTTPPPTDPPTPPPTNSPTLPQPTPSPTNPPTPPPTNPPTPKVICARNEPLPATICADGTAPGGGCSDVGSANSCGNGNKVCWWNANCPGGEGPAPTPPPTASPPTGGCNYCSAVGGECCGTCIDSGKPSNRGCF